MPSGRQTSVTAGAPATATSRAANRPNAHTYFVFTHVSFDLGIGTYLSGGLSVERRPWVR
jgi:hypothetical protein